MLLGMHGVEPPRNTRGGWIMNIPLTLAYNFRGVQAPLSRAFGSL